MDSAAVTRADSASDVSPARHGPSVVLGRAAPLKLDCGAELSNFRVSYQTYGTLNAERNNVVLACHALTGDQYVTDIHPVTGKPGWWEHMVGPGLTIDTERYFVLCANVLGGCMGTIGPTEVDPESGRRYDLEFPIVTVADMVRAQVLLLDHLGIDKVLCVTGGSMGGMQAVQWLAAHPERLISAAPIACAAKHTAQNVALHEIGRRAIMADQNWRGGRYAEAGVSPDAGLAVARMVGHVSYLSEAALERKFGRRLQNREALAFGFDPEFQVESYLQYQGEIFVERFDANCYLYLTRAMDYFDLIAENDGDLSRAFAGVSVPTRVFSFTGDWLFPTAQNLEIVEALRAAGAEADLVETESDAGHDAFLLDVPAFHAAFADYLAEMCDRFKIALP